MQYYEKVAGMGKEIGITALISHIPVLAAKKGRENVQASSDQVSTVRCWGLPSPKAHQVSLIPVLYVVGGWGCWTITANFFHFAGGRGFPNWKNTPFCFSFLNYHYQNWGMLHTLPWEPTHCCLPRNLLWHKRMQLVGVWDLLVSCNLS